MNREEARAILLLYRPGTADAEDPQVELAMEVARQDAELGRWFSQHVQFQNAVRSKLRQIEVPDHLKMGLLVRHKAIPPMVWWPKPNLAWLGGAAALVLCLSLGAIWFRPAGTNRLANLQERMVSEVLRQYAMEWETNDMAQLRRSLAARGGPADYALPRGLQNLVLTGGGVLRWQTNSVSMVCFNRGGGQMLYLFVVKRNAIKDPPPGHSPEFRILHDKMTASWTEGDNTYVLAGPEEKDSETFVRKYL